MTTSDTNRKLPMKVKILFPLAQNAPTIQAVLQMYFLVYFHTNVLGIPALASSVILLIGRIWDFLDDPLIGVLVEKTKFKPKGKCLFWMKCTIPLVSIFMIFCYTAPNVSTSLKIVWAAVTYIGLGMTQSAYSVPKDSLSAKLTTDRVERAKLNSYYQVISVILNALIPAVTMPLVGILSGFGPNTAFTKLAVIYAVVFALMGYIGIRSAVGYEPEDEEDTQTAAAPSTGEMLKGLTKNIPALIILVMQIVKMLFSSVSGAILIYFCTYNLKNANIMSITSTMNMFVGMIPLLFLVWCHKNLEMQEPV